MPLTICVGSTAFADRNAFTLNNDMDIFPQTAKTRKRIWICSLARKISKDIQHIQSSYDE